MRLWVTAFEFPYPRGLWNSECRRCERARFTSCFCMSALEAQLLHDHMLCGRGRRNDGSRRRLQGDAAHETAARCRSKERCLVTGSRRVISKPTATCFEVTIIDFKCIRCPPNNRLQQISDPLLALVDRRQRMKQNCLFASKIGKN